MNMNFKCNVFKLINNKSVEVMNERKLKNIIMCFRDFHDKVDLEIDKFKETLKSKES